jgi:amidase
VKTGEVRPRELATVAADAIAAVNPAINAVIELYHDRVDSLDESPLGNGPFRGVPFLIKDVGGHEQGRKIEFGSRLSAGLVAEVDTYYAKLLRAAGSTSSAGPTRRNSPWPPRPRTFSTARPTRRG